MCVVLVCVVVVVFGFFSLLVMVDNQVLYVDVQIYVLDVLMLLMSYLGIDEGVVLYVLGVVIVGWQFIMVIGMGFVIEISGGGVDDLDGGKYVFNVILLDYYVIFEFIDVKIIIMGIYIQGIFVVDGSILMLIDSMLMIDGNFGVMMLYMGLEVMLDGIIVEVVNSSSVQV